MTRGEINKLDKVFREIIRGRMKCERCGGKNFLQVAHIHSRVARSTRWLPQNALLLCSGCHFWAHHHPTSFTAFLEAYRGKKALKDLEKLNAKISKKSYEQVLKELGVLG